MLRLRFKVVATSHEAPYKRDKWNFIQKGYFHLAERIFIKSSNICTCISQPLSEYYRRKYRKKVYFLPNGINNSSAVEFDYKKANSYISETASISNPYVLFAARRLMSTKGCHTMLEALHRINYKGQVFITGELEETTYLAQLRALADGLNVHFLGYVDPLNTLLALVKGCQLFIFPSETEGMSIMLLEVASVGRPIIASDIPENTQIFSKDEILYFKCGNAEELAQKLEFALLHPEYMEALGLKAQKQVLSNYLWTDIALLYDNIFKNKIG